MLSTLAQEAVQNAPEVSEAIQVAEAGAKTGIAAIGAGLAAVGAGIGIGRIGGDANIAMARQPEMMSDIRASSMIFAALIEGVAFFGAVIALLFAL